MSRARNLVATTGSGYSPGALRRAADRELALVEGFLRRHQEYARLSHLELVTLASTYVDEVREAELEALYDAGVPLDWHRPDDDVVDNPEEGV